MLLSLIQIYLQSNTCCIISSNILSTGYFSWKLKLMSNHLRQMSTPHWKQSIDLQSIGRFLSETNIGVKRINFFFFFQKSQHDVVFQINSQGSLLFSFILKMKFQRIYRCNHWTCSIKTVLKSAVPKWSFSVLLVPIIEKYLAYLQVSSLKS